MLAWATQVLALALHIARAETYIIERKPPDSPTVPHARPAAPPPPAEPGGPGRL